eukprot:1158578-Pelagomonas_calceolata.AAC.3
MALFGTPFDDEELGASFTINLPSPPFPDVSDWYFQVALERGWFGWHQYYCKLATKTSKVDSNTTADIIDCSDTSIPYTQGFALLTQEGDQVPAVTGQPLLLLSFTHGLCSSKPSSQPSSSSWRYQHSHASIGPERLLRHDLSSSRTQPRLQAESRQAQEAEGVRCSTEDMGSSTFSLLSPDSESGQAIPFSTPVYLLEGKRYASQDVGTIRYREDKEGGTGVGCSNGILTWLHQPLQQL